MAVALSVMKPEGLVGWTLWNTFRSAKPSSLMETCRSRKYRFPRRPVNTHDGEEGDTQKEGSDDNIGSIRASRSHLTPITCDTCSRQRAFSPRYLDLTQIILLVLLLYTWCHRLLVGSSAFSASKQSTDRNQLLPALRMHVTTHFMQLGSSIPGCIGMKGSRGSVSAESKQSSSQPHHSSSISSSRTSHNASRTSGKATNFINRCPLSKANCNHTEANRLHLYANRSGRGARYSDVSFW